MISSFLRSRLLLIAGTLVCLSAFDHLTPFLFYHFLPPGLIEWNRIVKHEELLKTLPNKDVVFLGDSAGELSMSPVEWQQDTGLSAVNLATTADRVDFADPYLLIQYLKHHAPPKAIVIVRSLHSWDTGGVRGGLLFREEFADPTLEWKLFRDGYVTPHDAMLLVLDKIFPSLSLRNRLAYARGTMLDPAQQQLNIYNKNYGAGLLGWEPFDSQMHNVHMQIDDANTKKIELLDPTKPAEHFDAFQIDMLHYLCTLSTARGAQLYFANSPNAHALGDNPRVQQFAAKAMSSVQQAFQGMPNCHVFPDLNIMDDADLSDLTHTTPDGAAVFTKKIAGEVMAAGGK